MSNLYVVYHSSCPENKVLYLISSEEKIITLRELMGYFVHPMPDMTSCNVIWRGGATKSTFFVNLVSENPEIDGAFFEVRKNVFLNALRDAQKINGEAALLLTLHGHFKQKRWETPIFVR